MARQAFGLVALLLCSGVLLSFATAQESAPAVETLDLNKELEKLKGWKAYLLGEVDKHKAELEKSQTALKTEQDRAAELTSSLEQWKKAATDAEARATAAETRATAAETRATAAETRATAAEAQLAQLKQEAESAQAQATEAAAKATQAEALATSHAHYSSQLTTQIDQLKSDLAAAEARAAAHSAAADSANGETALLRKQLAEAIAERQSLDDRVTELANAASKAGGLRGHALAIYDILLEEVARHRETALNYANEKLPGFKAKVSEVHATVSSKVPNVTEHVSKFVNNVDGELRPWLRHTLGSVPALKPYSEDPVVLQGITYVIIGAPVLLLLLPLLSVIFRLLTRRPSSSSSLGRGSDPKAARRNKKKQG